jgi:hypothetical protein
VVEIAKLAIKPFFISKKITKDDYKEIMKKVVVKTLDHAKETSSIDSVKINKLVVAYVHRSIKDKRVANHVINN